MKIKTIIVFIFLISSLIGCKSIPVGSSYSGYENVIRAKIQLEEAVKLAKPYLDRTFELRKLHSDLSRSEDKEPGIFVTLKNRYYYIVKENHPAKSVNFYLDHAVKVHINSGEIIPPK